MADDAAPDADDASASPDAPETSDGSGAAEATPPEGEPAGEAGGDEAREEPREPPLSEVPREALEDRVRSLESDLAEARDEVDDHVERLQRLKADFDNYRKRKDREMEAARTRAEDELLEELVGVLDSFDRALDQAEDEAAREGIRMIRKQFLGVLESNGVERVEPEGEAFDPAEHEAVLREASEEADEGDVLQVLEPGYVRGGTVLRPARVKVAAAPEAEAGDGA